MLNRVDSGINTGMTKRQKYLIAVPVLAVASLGVSAIMVGASSAPPQHKAAHTITAAPIEVAPTPTTAPTPSAPVVPVAPAPVAVHHDAVVAPTTTTTTVPTAVEGPQPVGASAPDTQAVEGMCIVTWSAPSTTDPESGDVSGIAGGQFAMACDPATQTGPAYTWAAPDGGSIVSVVPEPTSDAPTTGANS